MNSFLSILLPMVAAGIALAVFSVVQRLALLGKKKSFLLFLSGSQAVLVVLFAGIYLVMWGLIMPPNLKDGFWSAVCLGTFANYGIVFCHAKANTYDAGEVSLLSPISAMTPGLVTLLAITLGEFPGLRGWTGILCLAVGSWVLLSPKVIVHWWEYFTPFRHIGLAFRYHALEKKDQERAIVVWLVLGSAVLSTFGLLASGLYTRRGGDTQGWWLAVIVLWSVLSIVYAIQYFLQDVETRKSAREEWKESGDWVKFWLYSGVCACLIVVLTAIEYTMYTYTFIAYVGALKRLSILFSVVLGLIIFNEQDIKKRFVAAVIIVVGALLIGSEDMPTRLTDKIEFLW